jgi:hypothetical protein
MPCDSIITQSVDLSKCPDANMLRDAILSLDGVRDYYGDYYHSEYGKFSINNGKVCGDSRFIGSVADKIKQAYSKKSVYAAAKKQGWLVKEVGPNKLQVIRRF